MNQDKKSKRAQGLATAQARHGAHVGLDADACRRYSCRVHGVNRRFVADIHGRPKTKKQAQRAPYWQPQRWGGDRRGGGQFRPSFVRNVQTVRAGPFQAP
jgi:hypothetical protein